jgi:serine/threonine-protein kinase
MRPGLKMLASLLTLRALFVIVSLALLVAPLSSTWLHFPDRLIFRFGAFLAPVPDSPRDIVKIEVPDREIERLVKDSTGAIELGKLFDSLRNVYSKGILLVSPELPYTENYAANLLVTRLAENQKIRNAMASAGMLDDVSRVEDRYAGFSALVNDGALMLAVKENADEDAAVRYLRQSQILPLSNIEERGFDANYLPVWYRDVTPLAKFRSESDVIAYPVFDSSAGDMAYPLVWKVVDDYFPDAALALYRKRMGQGNILWQHNEAIVFGEQVIGTNIDGTVFPVFSEASGVVADVPVYSLSEALQKYRELDGKTVVIGSKDDPAVDTIVGMVVGLETGAYSVEPHWYLMAEKIGLVVLGVYLLVVVPLLRFNMAILLTVMLFSFLLVAQLGLQITQNIWFPAGLLLVYLAVGHLLMIGWLSQRRYIQGFQQEADVYALRLAQSLFDQSDWDEALTILAEARPTDDILELTYEIAAGLERKRLYRQSIEVYRLIVRRKRNFRDSAKRVKTLEAKEADRQQGENMESTQTLALSAPEKKPSLGRYEVDRELGRGAMGVVYLGHDPRISRLVAIKTLQYKNFPKHQLDDLKKRFFREAEAAGRLNHPNIISVFDAGEEGDMAYIAMDYIEGASLAPYTEEGNLLDPDTVYWIIAEVAHALGYAHEQGIVHRDIKPSNIMYDPERQEVKVADFGIARITDTSNTRTGDVLGSPLYMSPEQLKGDKVEGASDIFSLGVTFYQLLTGRLPFSGDTLASLTYEIINSKYSSVTDVNPGAPASANRLIQKALNKKPDRRYETAYEFSAAIEKQREKGL